MSHVEPDAKGTYVIDAVYAFAHAIHNIIEDYCPNKIVCDRIITKRSFGEAINGTLLREYLSNVSFPSTFSSELLFDSNGDALGSYDIKNLQFTTDNQSSFKTVGTWAYNTGLQVTETIEWNSGNEEAPQSVCSLPCKAGYQPHILPDQEQCCWECRPCLGGNSVSSGERCYECHNEYMPNQERSSCIEIPLTYFTWSNPWAVSIILLTCIGIVTAICVAVMFVIFHRNRVIKASSRELSAILLVGILLCYILPFFFIVMPSPALCGVRRFAIGFCFAISYSALLVRSNRIHRIFNQPIERITKPPRFIGAMSQVLFSASLISIQVLIAVIWLAAEYPSVKIIQVNSQTLELKCGESPYFGLPVSLCYNLFLLLLSTYFAFLTRKVPDNYNEAKFINITLYSLCIIWIAFVPTYFVSTRFGTVYENFFLLLAIFLSASTTLLCLLVPKFIIIFWEKRNHSSEKPTSKFTASTTCSSGL